MKMSALFACFLGGRERRSPSTTTDRSNNSPVCGRDTSSQLEIVYVELLKHNDEPLGLKLEGGTDHDIPVRVSQLYPGGVACLSNALQNGDRVLSINGTVTAKLTHNEVLAVLENAERTNAINLEIAFDALPDGGQKIDDGMELKTAIIKIPCYHEENVSFPGFVISGGILENRPITISHVKQGSFPYKKGILRAGDRILQVNGIDMRNASRSDADQLLIPTEGGSCELQIEYDVPVHDGLEDTNGPLIVELQKPQGASLGISLSDDRISGQPIVISRVREAGIADRSGALHIGDRLLSVNGQSLDHLSVREARHLLTHSSIVVKLEIMPAHNFTDRPGFSPIEDALSDVSSRTSHTTPSITNQRRPSQLSLTSASPTSQILSHPEVMTVKLIADPIGFGIRVQGGYSEYSNFPIVISEVIPNGPAGLLGQLMVGDRILSINGESVADVSLDHASKLIKEANDCIQLEVEFDVTDSPVIPTSGTFEVNLVKSGCLTLGISIRSSGDKIWISDMKRGGIAYRSGSLQIADILLAINGQSLINATVHEAAAMLSNTDDAICLNIKRESINNFNSNKSMSSKTDPVIYSVELTRNGQRLGISLNGSDQPGQPIVISDIREGSVAHRTGAIKVNDRIIAINGESLLTKNIQDAYRMLQTAGDTVTLKISKGVVSRRGKGQRSRVGSVSGRYYRHPRYGSRYRSSHTPRLPSRISPTSESELSESHVSLEDAPPYNRHKYVGATSNSSGVLAGSSSPTRQKPGRLSPPKERTSPRGLGKSAAVQSDLVEYRRSSITETTDEETLYDDTDRNRSWSIRRYQSGSKNGYHSSFSHYGSKNLVADSNSTYPRSRNITSRKPSNISPGKRSPEPVAKPLPVQNSLPQQPPLQSLEEKMIETMLKSREFVEKFKRLAAQSGSDSETETSSLPAHVHKELLDHVHSLMSPVQMKLVNVTVKRNGGFGFSVSDGLLEPGVYVNQIQPNGPADGSGLEPFDKIIKMNGIIVENYDCCKIKPLFSQADVISLTISRNPLAVGNGAAAKPSIAPPLQSPLTESVTDFSS